MNIAPGQQLLHFRIVQKLGEGGMGVVWKAVDTTLDREVAIKFLPEWGVTAGPSAEERRVRFEREARLLAPLNHPNIASVYGLHRTPDEAQAPFIAMEFVRGEVPRDAPAHGAAAARRGAGHRAAGRPSAGLGARQRRGPPRSQAGQHPAERGRLGYTDGVAIDQSSRVVAGFAVFPQPPTSEQVQSFLDRAIAACGSTPVNIVTDKGRQFWCAGFKRWCRRRGIRPRYGAVGQPSSIAVVERFILSLKQECTRMVMVPLSLTAMRRALRLYTVWFNGHRPHTALVAKTPREVHDGRTLSRRCFETRPRPRRTSPRLASTSILRPRPGAGYGASRVDSHRGSRCPRFLRDEGAPF